MAPTQIQEWTLKNLPEAEPNYELGKADSTFELKKRDVPELKDSQILIQAVYYSNDPAQRGWVQKGMNPKRLYRPPAQQGDVMPIAAGIWKVVKSKSSKYPEGSFVFTGEPGWADYAVVNDKDVDDLPDSGNLPKTTLIGALGFPGLTAYFGMKKVLEFQEGQSIIVSGAAGAVGNVVVQLAKHVYKSKKVIAIAGTDEKCKWLKTIGADVAINYKSKTFVEELNKAANGEVDAFFDNVGVNQLDAVLPNLRQNGRVAACGAIATYNGGDSTHLSNYTEIIFQRLRIEGFIVLDYMSEATAAQKEMIGYVQEGKLTIEGAETIDKVSFEDVPKTWKKLFDGGNTGKLLTQLSEE